MAVQPYLFFDGRCEEALEFYKRALGAEVSMLMRYKDSPEQQPGMVKPGYENKVMHATVRIGDSVVMAADDCMGNPTFQGFSLSLTVKNEAEADRAFAALAEGGQVRLVARCACRLRKRSSHPSSACWLIASGLAGSCTCRSDESSEVIAST
jgi:PhnB protein